jgi:hypothetical protein
MEKYSQSDDPKDAYSLTIEHVVPQSIFSNMDPYRGDLHIMFPALRTNNTLRDNKQFASPTTATTWEPPSPRDKGIVARACAYFFLVYPEFIDKIESAIFLKAMLEWHQANPPDTHELDRHKQMAQVQGNVNPFIIVPELMEAIFTNKPMSRILVRTNDVSSIQSTYGYLKTLHEVVDALRHSTSKLDEIINPPTSSIVVADRG